MEAPPAHRLLRSGATAVAAAALAAAALTTPASSAPPAGAPPAGAPASAAVVITGGAVQRGYDTPLVRVARGGRLSVVNLDDLEHTVTAEGHDGAGQPLFRAYAEPGRTTRVPGVERLAPGSYRFFCQFHPAMRGTLVVEGRGDGVRPVPTRFEQPLVVPRPLRGRHIVLTMRESAVRVLPHGPLTRMWTFNGSYPGPTLVLPAGRRSDVTVVDRLPAAAGAFSLHLHGDHHPSGSDGQPASLPVTRAVRRTYEFPLTDGGRPEPAAFDWYHDHRMGVTARNNWRGLQGMALVTDPTAARLGLPEGRFALPIMLSERSFTAGNQLTDPFAGSHPHARRRGAAGPPDDATVGERVLVNGRAAPYANVAGRRYRLLLVNTSPFSSYDLELSDGRPFVQVGTGNGLLPHPVVRQDVLLGPAQRVDVVVDLADAAHQRVVLRSVPRVDRPAGAVGTVAADLLELRVGAVAADPSRIPATLRPLARLALPRTVARTWTVGLTGARGRVREWTLDGKPFDARAVAHRVRRGSVQVWELRNPTRVTHYMHVHEEQWRTVSRDGRPPPPWERGLEDTWRLDPGESVRIAARFTDHVGPFMIHCHMLDHEDHGLMAQFLVVR